MTGQAAENRRRIFISHSERDAFVAERFEHLLAKITAQDLECFVASKAIRCGREWFPRLNQALSETSALVAPLTPASLSSSWVPYEVGFAYAHKRPAFGIALGISLQQAQRGPYAAIPFSPHREEPLAAAVSEICSTLGIQPDVALVRREVGKFNDEIRQHIEASVDRYAEVEQVHSAGVVDHLVPTLAGFIGDDEALTSRAAIAGH